MKLSSEVDPARGRHGQARAICHRELDEDSAEAFRGASRRATRVGPRRGGGPDHARGGPFLRGLHEDTFKITRINKYIKILQCIELKMDFVLAT